MTAPKSAAEIAEETLKLWDDLLLLRHKRAEFVDALATAMEAYAAAKVVETWEKAAIICHEIVLDAQASGVAQPGAMSAELQIRAAAKGDGK